MESILPLIPYGASEIAEYLTVINEKNSWTYFIGGIPFFSHPDDDTVAFRIITSSFIDNGLCKNIDIIKVFNISKSSVIRSNKKFKEGGSQAFLTSKKTRGNATVLTTEVIKKAEELLYEGLSCRETAVKLEIKYSTLSKGITSGRVKKIVKLNTGTTKSERSIEDNSKGTEMGVGCVRSGERVLASMGMLRLAESRFLQCSDIKNGGVLLALPALLSNGLYHEINNVFDEFSGYYTMTQVLTLLGFMGLCRVKTVEQVGKQPPGEWGKLLGLDRIPGVKCLREKLAALAKENSGTIWGEHLSTKWMEENPDLTGALYIDGHVRLYGGKEKIPKQYVSRERLCLKGMMDFWVNDMIGQPFFVVRKDINPGMISTLREDIIPQLLKTIPNQPSDEELENNPFLHRFIIIFDREGYSPAFFLEMWIKYRIACMTYHKFPNDDWPEKEFKKTPATLVSGEQVTMKLAERGTFIGNKKTGVWVKEVRKLTNSGHQTSIISTGYTLNLIMIAVLMFARWCQENFFNYMMQHFAIDLLTDYNKKKVSDTDKVVTREWRDLGKKINSLNGKLQRRKSRFADFTLNPMKSSNVKRYQAWETHKISLAEEIELISKDLNNFKKKQKSIEKYVIIKDLPDNEQFRSMDHSGKNVVDVIKMVSYRAETAMANLIINECGSLASARSLLQTVFVTEADFDPDYDNKILHVKLHNLSTIALDKKVDILITHLNLANIKYPGTQMILHYSRIS